MMFTQAKKQPMIVVVNPHITKPVATDTVRTLQDVELLAQKTVLYAMHNEKSEDCFFDAQSTASIFYKVYNDLYLKDDNLATYFAKQLDTVYEITIPLN